jgi:DtxR family Mn-dependent transcriptional regulator
MEPLQRLTRRQLLVLQAVGRLPAGRRGVSLADIADSLRIRPPSALEHLRALQYMGLVSRSAGKTKLTSIGAKCLKEYDRHHRIAENLFARLNLEADDACRAAREIDLALSHKTVEALCAAQGHPKTCPHGEPILSCEPEAAKEV